MRGKVHRFDDGLYGVTACGLAIDRAGGRELDMCDTTTVIGREIWRRHVALGYACLRCGDLE